MWERCLQPTVHDLRRQLVLVLYNQIFNMGCQIKGLDQGCIHLHNFWFIVHNDP